jgi:hypothetical protein
VSKRNQGKKRNGHKAMSGENGRGRGTSAGRVSSGALEGASILGVGVQEGAGKGMSVARGSRRSAQTAGLLALAFAKRNPLALAGVAAAGAGIGIALWLFGDREALKSAVRSIGRFMTKIDLTTKGAAPSLHDASRSDALPGTVMG